MTYLNGKQFWKANPNQMALPGMEDHAHPLAHHLADGYHFEAKAIGPADARQVRLSANHTDRPNANNEHASQLEWHATSGDMLHKRGEINWVETDWNHSERNLGSDLYGFARHHAQIKPQHSVQRSYGGDVFADRSASLYGGRVPASLRQRYLKRHPDLPPDEDVGYDPG